MDKQSAAQDLFSLINSMPALGWVGGGDAAGVGTANWRLVQQNCAVPSNAKILDFGCGVGRTAIAALATLGSDAEVVGMDIVSPMIAFCNSEIVPRFPNSRFFCTAAAHPAYDEFKKEPGGTAETVDEEKVWTSLAGKLDLVMAFSVFSHFNPPMAGHYLKKIRQSLARTGTVLFTCFLLDPLSAAAMRSGTALNPANPDGSFPDAPTDEDETYDFNRLYFSGLGQKLLLGLVDASGLYVDRILYGSWRRGAETERFQDCVVAKVKPYLPADFDPRVYVSLHPDLRSANVEGTRHWLNHGFYENRKYR